jgi:glycosyltransferase involved in cell wall biosynthesis
MACGLPCIGSSAVGIPEAIEPGVTGLLAPPGDPAVWAEAIARIGSDAAAAARMAEAARRRVEERYARPACMERLAGIFLQFTREHRATRGA